LRPYIVLVPHHAFVAVNLDAAGKQRIAIETTTVGTTGSLGKFLESGLTSFERAESEGGREYNEAIQSKTLELIDIKECRQKGIAPYPYYQKLGRADVSVLKRLGIEK
jgi:hypothetical protein